MVLTVVAVCLTMAGNVVVAQGVSLVTYEDWVNAINSGNVQPYTTWDNGLEYHYPGESGSLVTSTLTAVDLGTPPYPEVGPGLLMEWESGMGAWEYDFGAATDLTGYSLSFEIYPPTGITSVSVGLIDAWDNVKSWEWSVGPGGLPPDQVTPITVALGSGGGTGAQEPSVYQDYEYNSEDAKTIRAGEKGPLYTPANNKWLRLRVVPEPGSFLALSSGLVGLIGLGMRRRRA